MTSTPNRKLPNRRIRCVMLAIQEMMGRNGLNATLKTAGLQHYLGRLPLANNATEIQASEYAAMLQAIETQLGSGARGQLNRLGHTTFKYVVADDKTTWTLLAFTNRFRPARQRLARALSQLAKHLAEPEGQVGVEAADQRLLFVDEASDGTYGRQRNVEICWLTLGMIQECIQWATGSTYEVMEIACKAKGDASCKFEIGQKLN